MPNIEERIQAIEREHQTLEQEHNQLKKTIELQTIAIGALVTKSTLEKLNEKHDKLIETLITHDHFTNVQLAEIRTQQTELDGKIVGLQTETRQRFSQVDTRFDKVDERFSQVDIRFDKIEGDIVVIKSDMSTLKSDVSTLKSDVSTLKSDVSTLKSDVTSIRATMTTREDMTAMESRIIDTFKQLLNPQDS